MLKRKTYPVLAVLGVLVVGTGALWMSRQVGRWEPGWGGAILKVAERAYYEDRIETIIENWQHLARFGEREIKTGRVAEPGFTCLVIDLAAKEMWIERDGKVLPEYHGELPKGMTWKLRHCGPHRNAELASPARFRVRGLFSDRQPQERMFLVGQSDRTGFLEFSFNSSDRGRGHGSRTWTPNLAFAFPFDREDEEGRYGSIVVSDAEYAEAKAGFSADTARPEGDEASELRENRAAWTRIEKRLYQEIDRHVEAEGFELRRLEVTCGPDRSAASAELRAGRSGLLSGLRGDPSSRQAYLKIDLLEDDVWYVKSALDSRHPMPTAMRHRFELELEFLVSAAGAVPKERRANLLEQGRAKQAETPQSPSKWRVTLPNGATVEFVGICESPSGGKDWWGPDGSRLEYVPYVNCERYCRPLEDRSIYEIAWRVTMPPAGKSGTSSSLEGSVGSYGRQIHDRYGSTIREGLHAQGYAFEKSRKTTTLRLGVSVDEGEREWVRFENISLVAGEDPGFEIVQGGGPVR